jgi:hypothetical protein
MNREWDRSLRWGKVRLRVRRAFWLHSQLTTQQLAAFVYPRGHKCKLWYLGRVASQFADRTGERRWPDGNVWHRRDLD